MRFHFQDISISFIFPSKQIGPGKTGLFYWPCEGLLKKSVLPSGREGDVGQAAKEGKTGENIVVNKTQIWFYTGTELTRRFDVLLRNAEIFFLY
jgi:hypothetical protein